MKRIAKFFCTAAFVFLAAALCSCGGADQESSVSSENQPAPSAVSDISEMEEQIVSSEPDTYESLYNDDQDYYRTSASSKNYTSSKIVIGDSRCCQLGDHIERSGKEGFAYFGVWGGHYLRVLSPQILSENRLSDVEECFKAQIDACGRSVIYFFATVNDYDCEGENDISVKAAADAAERLASLEYTQGGTVFHPSVVVIGIEGIGAGDDYFANDREEFNRLIPDYNNELYSAVLASDMLSDNAQSFISVPDITGGNTSFLSDGVHYSEETLEIIASYIRNH